MIKYNKNLNCSIKSVSTLQTHIYYFLSFFKWSWMGKLPPSVFFNEINIYIFQNTGFTRFLLGRWQVKRTCMWVVVILLLNIGWRCDNCLKDSCCKIVFAFIFKREYRGISACLSIWSVINIGQHLHGCLLLLKS